MTGGAGAYSQSAEGLGALASAFRVQSDALSAAGMAMTAGESLMESDGWGSAGELERIGYIAAAKAATTAIDALSGVLGAVGNTVAALAESYGATEDETAGLFDQIGF